MSEKRENILNLKRKVVVSILRSGGNEVSKEECVHPFALIASS
jgi:hypothetical protein